MASKSSRQVRRNMSFSNSWNVAYMGILLDIPRALAGQMVGDLAQLVSDPDVVVMFSSSWSARA